MGIHGFIDFFLFLTDPFNFSMKRKRVSMEGLNHMFFQLLFVAAFSLFLDLCMKSIELGYFFTSSKLQLFWISVVWRPEVAILCPQLLME